MAREGSSRWDRAIDVGSVVLLLGGAFAIRQRSAFFYVPGFAILILSLGWQTFAKLTHRSTVLDAGGAHVGFCLTAALMIFGGGMQVLAPRPDTAGFVRVLGGFVSLAGAVMIAAEVGDFRSWKDRMAEDERSLWW
jgi:hypothetical protein